MNDTGYMILLRTSRDRGTEVVWAPIHTRLHTYMAAWLANGNTYEVLEVFHCEQRIGDAGRAVERHKRVMREY